MVSAVLSVLQDMEPRLRVLPPPRSHQLASPQAAAAVAAVYLRRMFALSAAVVDRRGRVFPLPMPRPAPPDFLAGMERLWAPEILLEVLAVLAEARL